MERESEEDRVRGSERKIEREKINGKVERRTENLYLPRLVTMSGKDLMLCVFVCVCVKRKRQRS